MESKELKRTLVERGIQVKELAARVGVSRPYISDIANGHRLGGPSMPAIEAALAAIIAEREAEQAAVATRRAARRKAQQDRLRELARRHAEQGEQAGGEQPTASIRRL